MERVNETPKKLGKITKNRYLNFLREFRANETNKGKSGSKIVKAGAIKYNRLTENEKKNYAYENVIAKDGSAENQQQTENECIICYDGENNSVLNPCGHMFCSRCVLRIYIEASNARCPLCGAKIDHTTFY